MIDLLRAEFAQDVPTAKEALAMWDLTPADPPPGVLDMVSLIARFTQAVESVGLQGFAGYLVLIGQFTDSLLARTTEMRGRANNFRAGAGVGAGAGIAAEDAATELAVGIVWLGQWVDEAVAYLENPAHPLIVEHIAHYLSLCPLPFDENEVLELASILLVAPEKMGEGADGNGETLEAATQEDVGLNTDEVDPELLQALLADAPHQLAQLEIAVANWSDGNYNDEVMVEALRSAHTFKGSGNIIGLPGIGRLAHRLEDILEFALDRFRRSEPLPVGLDQDVMQAVHCLEQMVGNLQGLEAPPDNAVQILQNLLDWVAQIRGGNVVQSVSDQPIEAALLGEAIDDQADDAQSIEVSTPAMSGSSGQRIENAARPKTGDATVMRVGVNQLSRLLRRAGQSIIHTERLSNLLADADGWLVALERNNQLMANRLMELDVLVNSQAIQLREAQEVSGTFDPLELDRYDVLHGLSRFIGETARDSSALVQQARESTAKSGIVLREEGYALVDQHRELLAARMVAVRTILPRLKRTVAQTAIATGRKVMLQVTGEDVVIDADVLARLAEPLLHLLRNAVDHGIESPQDRVVAGKPEQGVVQLDFQRVGDQAVLRVSDDGRGLDLGAIETKALNFGLIDAAGSLPEPELIRLILHPGFSTRDKVTETSGRGVGMDIVNDRITALKGRLDIDSAEGLGSFFTVHVPVSSGVAQALLVECAGETVALPLEQVSTLVAAGLADFQVDASGVTVLFDGVTYPAFALAQWLEVEDYSAKELLAKASNWIVVLAVGSSGMIALLVDAVLESRELILQEVGRLTRRVQGVIGAALRADGRPLFLMSVTDLQRAASAPRRQGNLNAMQKRMRAERIHILVVDDAWSVRRSMQQLLEDAGYEVAEAADGFDALDRIRGKTPALVITDLEMPNLNGLELTRRMREIPQWAEIPVVMITSRTSSKHRDEGQRAGVSVYLTKPYQDAELLAHVRSLTLDLTID